MSSRFSSVLLCPLLFPRKKHVRFVQRDFHVRWCAPRLTVTWRVSLVEQILPPFRRTRVHPQWGSCYSIFGFLCNVLLIVVCPFVHFPLAIVLSVLRFTDSDYPFGIFKLFSKSVNSRRTDNTMVKWKRKKTFYKTLHRKLKIEQHEPHYKPGWTQVLLRG